MKKAAYIVPALSLLVSSTLYGCGLDRDTAIDYYNSSKSELEAAVAEILENQSADGIALDGIQSISYWGGDDTIIEFEVYTSGIAPSTTYGGIYYSVSGEPAGFQNTDVTLVETADGWEWQADGGNCGETVHIEGNWYTYEAEF